jgi:O-antigen ligase/polysaccharide polymerase Wzy-like membrane protein
LRAWILERFQVYGRVCLMAAVFLSPLVFYRRTVDNFNLPKLTLLWVLGLLALALWIAWSAERRVWLPRFRLLYAAAAFWVAFVLATVFSQNRAVSLVGVHQRYDGLIPFTLYITIMIAIVGLYWERPDDVREIARAAAAGSILMAVYVLIQAAGLDWIPWRNPGGGNPVFPVGTMGNSNFAGAYLGVTIPFLIYVVTTAKSNFAKAVLGILAGVDLVALWTTQTRGGLAGAVAALVTMAFMYRDRLPKWARAMAALVLVAGVALAALAASMVFRTASAPSSAAPPIVGFFRTETFSSRADYWITALRIFRQHPVLGTGPETFYSNYPPNRTRADGALLGSAIPDKPHNIYLEYAANTGAIGLGSYLILAGLGLWYAYRRARKLQDQERLLLVAFLAAFAGYLVQGTFSIDVVPLAVTGWIALGSITALADPNVVDARERQAAAEKQKRKPGSKKSRRSSEDTNQVSGSARWPIHAGIALSAAALLALGIRPLVADEKAASEAVKQSGRTPVGEVAQGFEQAIRAFPLESTYRRFDATFAQKKAAAASDPAQKVRWLAKALARYQEAYRLLPTTANLMSLAEVKTAWAEIDPNRFAEADKAWAALAAYDSTNYQVHQKYAAMLNSWADALGGDSALQQRAAKQLLLGRPPAIAEQTKSPA